MFAVQNTVAVQPITSSAPSARSPPGIVAARGHPIAARSTITGR